MDRGQQRVGTQHGAHLVAKLARPHARQQRLEGAAHRARRRPPVERRSSRRPPSSRGRGDAARLQLLCQRTLRETALAADRVLPNVDQHRHARLYQSIGELIDAAAFVADQHDGRRMRQRVRRPEDTSAASARSVSVSRFERSARISRLRSISASFSRRAASRRGPRVCRTVILHQTGLPRGNSWSSISGGGRI